MNITKLSDFITGSFSFSLDSGTWKVTWLLFLYSKSERVDWIHRFSQCSNRPDCVSTEERVRMETESWMLRSSSVRKESLDTFPLSCCGSILAFLVDFVISVIRASWLSKLFERSELFLNNFVSISEVQERLWYWGEVLSISCHIVGLAGR